MIDQEQLASAFGLNLNIIKRQTESMSHADSLLQPPFRGNCLNWVLGHIVVNRNRVLKLLGEGPVVREGDLTRYETDSEPVIADGPGVMTLDELLETLEHAQGLIAAGLQRATSEDLSQKVKIGEREMTVGQRLFGLYFHETYHTGQTELLRQLAGKDDKVV